MPSNVTSENTSHFFRSRQFALVWKHYQFTNLNTNSLASFNRLDELPCSHTLAKGGKDFIQRNPSPKKHSMRRPVRASYMANNG